MQSFLAATFALSVLLALCTATAVDDPVCYAPFFDLRKIDPNNSVFFPKYVNETTIVTNYTAITYQACAAKCGTAPNLYTFADVQQRIATWIVPLLVLIGSMHFVPLGKRNVIQDIVHLLADPISVFQCLLSRLVTQQQRATECPFSEAVPHGKDLAMIVTVYEAWRDNILCIKREGTVRDGDDWVGMSNERQAIMPDGDAMLRMLKEWLEVSPEMRDGRERERLDACKTAAKELVDCRVSGVSITLLATINYIVLLAASLYQVTKGELNNRTGHSISFAVLYSWLIPTVLLSNIVGGFSSKNSSRAVLERLYKELTRLKREAVNERVAGGETNEKDAASEPGAANKPDEPDAGNGFQNPVPATPLVSPFTSFTHDVSSAKVYQSLPWCGGNYSYYPIQCHQEQRTRHITYIISLIPTLVAMLSSVFMSYLSPTRGLGCRSMQQIAFYIIWLLSTAITYSIQKRVSSARQQWILVLTKDWFILVAQGSVFVAGFSGWFNSCWCRSCFLWLGDQAHVVLDPKELSKALARKEWPLVILAMLLLHSLLTGAIWSVYWKGSRLYRVEE